MTDQPFKRAGEQLQMQAGFSGFYNASPAELIPSAVMREHGLQAVERLITKPIRSGASCSSPEHATPEALR